LIDKELLEDETINPPEEVRSLCQFSFLSDNRDLLLNKAWTKVVSALREKAPKPADVEVAAGSDGN
jgi:hypothetical protein